MDTIVLDEPGGSARDIVRFVSIADSGLTAATRDTVGNFVAGSSATADRIDLSAIDARPLQSGNQAFAFVGNFTSAAGEVRVTTSGADTVVLVDTDSDSAAEMSFVVAGVTGLTAGDFIL